MDNGQSLDNYIDSLDGYFAIDPYWKWFKCYEPLLQGLGVSYCKDQGANGTVLHTDICSPIATHPTWSRLRPTVQRALWSDGQQLWHDLVRSLEPDVIVASVPNQYASGIQFRGLGAPRDLYTIARTNPYVVTIEEIELTENRRSWLVKGAAAQTPLGKVSNEHKRLIGQELKRVLDG
ncbi:MAG TPA: hypothetical protein VH107_04735 [Lacipirellulaceae bacterium]|nr:hypothetical protein [Lacipirellulaceae bacterium]